MLALIIFSANLLLVVEGMPQPQREPTSNSTDALGDYGAWFDSLMDWDYAETANTLYEHLPQSKGVSQGDK